MITRCHNPRSSQFKNYGGRGIAVCDRWRFGGGGASGFECFIADVGRRPDRSLSIDRRDNDKGYAPGNCRWATPIQQARNRQVTKLTVEQVAAIKAVPMVRGDITRTAHRFGVSQSMISRIRSGVAYADVEAEKPPAAAAGAAVDEKPAEVEPIGDVV